MSNIGATQDNSQNTPFAKKNNAVKNNARISKGPKNPKGLEPPPTLYSLNCVMTANFNFNAKIQTYNRL